MLCPFPTTARPRFVKGHGKGTKKIGMGKAKHHKSTIERTKKIRAITERYYEAGNNSKCYKAIWRKYVYPIYPMCYRTYLNYLNIPTPPPPPPTAIQLTLFDFLDKHPNC